MRLPSRVKLRNSLPPSGDSLEPALGHGVLVEGPLDQRLSAGSVLGAIRVAQPEANDHVRDLELIEVFVEGLEHGPDLDLGRILAAILGLQHRDAGKAVGRPHLAVQID